MLLPDRPMSTLTVPNRMASSCRFESGCQFGGGVHNSPLANFLQKPNKTRFPCIGHSPAFIRRMIAPTSPPAPPAASNDSLLVTLGSLPQSSVASRSASPAFAHLVHLLVGAGQQSSTGAGVSIYGNAGDSQMDDWKLDDRKLDDRNTASGIGGSKAGGPAWPAAPGSWARGTSGSRTPALPINMGPASPRQIAQALIRSMLGPGTSTANLSAASLSSANESLPANANSRPAVPGGPGSPPPGAPPLSGSSPANTSVADATAVVDPSTAAPLLIPGNLIPGNLVPPGAVSPEANAASAGPAAAPAGAAVLIGASKPPAPFSATPPGTPPATPLGAATPSVANTPTAPRGGRGAPAALPAVALQTAELQTGAPSGSSSPRGIGSGPLAFALRLTPRANGVGSTLSTVEGKSPARPDSAAAFSAAALDQPTVGSGSRPPWPASQTVFAGSTSAGDAPVSRGNPAGSTDPDGRNSGPPADDPTDAPSDNGVSPGGGSANSTANSTLNAAGLKPPLPDDKLAEDKAPEDSASDNRTPDDMVPAVAAGSVPGNPGPNPSGPATWAAGQGGLAGAESPVGNRSGDMGKPDPGAPISPAWPVPATPPAGSSPGAAQTPASGISVRIAAPGAAPVDVQLAERGGQVHVAVRTPDPALESSLRQDLNTLVDSLERSGFRSEVLIPASAPALAQAAAGSGAGQNGSQDAFQQGSQNSGRQDTPGQDTSGRGHHGQSAGQPFQSGAGGSGQQQSRPQQRQPQQAHLQAQPKPSPETAWTAVARASSIATASSKENSAL